MENSPLKLVIDRATDKLTPDDSLRASDDSDAPPGIALHFVNAGMNQNVPANLMLDDNDSSSTSSAWPRLRWCRPWMSRT